MAESVSKRQKKEDIGVSDDDRLSDLPDSLLCHILSFLPTKQAVGTSILSNRWRPLWQYTTSFDFDDRHCRNNKICKYSVQFVNEFLVSRDEPIKRFCFCCSSDFTSNQNINLWINAAIQRKVEHLEIAMFLSRFYIPCTIFTCKTIVVMKLTNVNLEAISSVSLPSLKILHLSNVLFSNASCASKLLSGCMLLENLVVRLIFTERWPDILLISFPTDFPKLMSADVRDFLSSTQLIQDCHSWTLLRALSKVQFLRYNIGRYFHADDVPIFHNLVHMDFNFRYYYSWNFLAKILENSPKLQILEVSFKMKSRTTTDDKNQHFVPPGFLSPLLRKCYVGEFEGNMCEIQFARYIMKNASDLRTFTISGSGSSESNAKLRLLKKLSSFTRLSATCVICFE